MPMSIEPGWVIEVETSDGIGEVEVSEQFYNLVERSEVVRIEYQVSRSRIREIKAKLLN